MRHHEKMKIIKWLLLCGLALNMGAIFGACPIAYPTLAGLNLSFSRSNPSANNGIELFKPHILFWEKIYFCQQHFNNTQLQHTILDSDIVTGGSHNVPYLLPDSFDRPLGQNTYDLTAAMPLDDMRIDKGLTKTFPKSGGSFGKMSLFNFYAVKTAGWNNCIEDNKQLVNSLRDLADRFVVVNNGNIIKRASKATTGKKIAIIEGIEFLSGSHKAKGNLTFYWTNPGDGQYFTNGGYRACWVGVGTRFVLDPTSIQSSGNFNVSLGVEVR